MGEKNYFMSHLQSAEIPPCAADPLCRCFLSVLLFSVNTLTYLPLSLWAANMLLIYLSLLKRKCYKRNAGGSDNEFHCFLYHPFWDRKSLAGVFLKQWCFWSCTILDVQISKTEIKHQHINLWLVLILLVVVFWFFLSCAFLNNHSVLGFCLTEHSAWRQESSDFGTSVIRDMGSVIQIMVVWSVLVESDRPSS